jgi:ribosomal RNA-processing protein 9
MKGDSFFMAAAKPRKSAGNTQKHSQSTAPMKKKGLKRKQTVQMQNDDDDYNEDDDDTVNFLDDDLERSDDSQSLASSANDDIGGQSKRESAQEKRVRLAKQYISTLDPVPSGTDGDREEYDAAEIDRSLVAERLRTEAQQLSGRYFNRAASSISGVRVAYQLRGHKSSATCLAVSPHSDFAFSGGKDGLIIQCKPLILC